MIFIFFTPWIDVALSVSLDSRLNPVFRSLATPLRALECFTTTSIFRFKFPHIFLNNFVSLTLHQAQRIDHGPGAYECLHFYNITSPCTLYFLSDGVSCFSIFLTCYCLCSVAFAHAHTRTRTRTINHIYDMPTPLPPVSPLNAFMGRLRGTSTTDRYIAVSAINTIF